jgi:hypothetical protein
MILWLLTAGLFLIGCALVVIRERAQQVQPVARTLAESVGTYSTYVVVVGMLVAFNLFQLDRIDPIFKTTGWYAFKTLYWPGGILTFAPLLICGSVLAVAVGIRRPRRIMALALLVAVTVVALETVILANVSVPGIVLVQVVLFVLFACGVHWASRSSQTDEPQT